MLFFLFNKQLYARHDRKHKKKKKRKENRIILLELNYIMKCNNIYIYIYIYLDYNIMESCLVYTLLRCFLLLLHLCGMNSFHHFFIQLYSLSFFGFQESNKTNATSTSPS